MDSTIKNFLMILKASLEGKRAEPDIQPDQWQALFEMASIHNVLPMFFEAVHAAPSLRQADLPIFPVARQQSMRQVMKQTMRTEEFLALNRYLQARGVRPLVVKGIICRNLYPRPDHRRSGDEDLLIPPEQFDGCHRLMMDFGMEPTIPVESDPGAYEVSYCKAGSALYIELHRHLFPPESDAYGDLNRFFQGVFDRAVPEQIRGDTVYTMAPTDHLLYLICHAFKHFLHSGFGIRQVCDIVLYANAWGSRIDWLQVLENCRRIRADKFAAAIFRIGEKHLVFDPERAAWPDAWREIRVDEMPMLTDLLAGGVYGSADTNRLRSSNITLDAFAAQKQGRKEKKAVLAAAFPPVSVLRGRYPCLEKWPWLLPAAWICRFWSYLSGPGGSDAAEALKIGSERIELMKEYGILN